MNINPTEYFHNNYGKEHKKFQPITISGFSRYDLIKLFRDFGFAKGAEVGVYEGEFSEYMCEIIPNLELFCVDPWENIPNDTRLKPEDRVGIENRYEKTKLRLSTYNCRIIKSVSLEAVRNISWESLDFVYIDGSHMFDYVMTDIIEWSKRVKSGGIVSGDDYYKFKESGVVQAVSMYTEMHRITEWFLTERNPPNFFWVKP